MIPEKSNGKSEPVRVSAYEHQRVADLPRDGGGLWWVWLIIVLMIVAGIVVYVVHREHESSADSPHAGGGRGSQKVPVVAAKARAGDLPIYLNGLGIVTPLSTVSVHTRIDGEIEKVLYTEGQFVKTGDLLVQIDPRPFQVMLTQAQGLLIRDQALLKDAQLNLVRYKQLLSQNLSITQAQVDTQQALVYQYEGDVKTDQGQIDSAQLNITYSNVTSPIDGRVGLRLVDQGNIVHAADLNPLVVITEIHPITVVFTVAEDDIPRVMKAMKTNPKLPVEAWDRDITTKLAEGTLLAIDNQVDPTSGTLKIKALFSNENNELFPSEFVNARLLIDTLHNATLVPSAAVQRGPDSSFIYVVQSDSTVSVKAITAGPTEGDSTVITVGISPGDLVVTDGVDKLQDKTPVVVRERNRKHAGAAAEPGAAIQAGAHHGGMRGAATSPADESAATRPAGEHRHHSSEPGSAE